MLKQLLPNAHEGWPSLHVWYAACGKVYFTVAGAAGWLCAGALRLLIPGAWQLHKAFGRGAKLSLIYRGYLGAFTPQANSLQHHDLQLLGSEEMELGCLRATQQNLWAQPQGQALSMTQLVPDSSLPAAGFTPCCLCWTHPPCNSLPDCGAGGLHLHPTSAICRGRISQPAAPGSWPEITVCTVNTCLLTCAAFAARQHAALALLPLHQLRQKRVFLLLLNNTHCLQV